LGPPALGSLAAAVDTVDGLVRLLGCHCLGILKQFRQGRAELRYDRIARPFVD
jgi:hypothetical protein